MSILTGVKLKDPSQMPYAYCWAAGAATVMLAVGEVIPLKEAVTVVLPTAAPVTTPVVLPIAATPVFADAQVTEEVISLVEPFEYVPLADMLEVAPSTTVTVAGVMAMLESVVADVLPPPPPPPHAVNHIVVNSQASAIPLCFVFIASSKTN